MFNCMKKIALSCVLLSASSLVTAESLVLTIASFSGEEKGQVVIELGKNIAPNHAARITQLAKEGLYDGVVFHRVIDGFMAQTGDVEFGNKDKLKEDVLGSGASSYDDLKAEFSDISFVTGVVGMARSRYIHSANSQFFIMTDTQTQLNGQYTVIGMVTSGMDVVNRIKKGSQAENGKVVQPDYIKTAVVIP